MSALTAIFILATVLGTCILSGVFGMAGGLLLMGVLATLLPINTALALHGAVQLCSNGWRMILHRRFIVWKTLGWFGLGSIAMLSVFSLIAFNPTKAFVFLMLGLMPMLIWIPERWFNLDAGKPSHAVAAGLVSSAFSLAAGVSGQITDLFFVRTTLTRHQVVATKAPMQAFGHVSKIFVYGAALFNAAPGQAIPLWLPIAALLLSMLGIVIGGWLLDRMSDDHFRTWRRWIVTTIGVVYLVQAALLIFKI